MAKPKKQVQLDKDIWFALKKLSQLKGKSINSITRDLVFGEGFAIHDLRYGLSFGFLRKRR